MPSLTQPRQKIHHAPIRKSASIRTRVLFPARFVFGKAKAYLGAHAIKQNNVGKYRTARDPAYERYGRMFIDYLTEKRFSGKKEDFVIKKVPFVVESTNGIALFSIAKQKSRNSGKIGWIGLGFTSRAVIVEVIQGKKDALAEQDRFRQHPDVKKHWPNYLLEEVESIAAKLGFREVKIRAPESLYSYHFSAHESMPEVRREMELLYSTVAMARGYKRRGLFYVKRL